MLDFLSSSSTWSTCSRHSENTLSYCLHSRTIACSAFLWLSSWLAARSSAGWACTFPLELYNLNKFWITLVQPFTLYSKPIVKFIVVYSSCLWVLPPLVCPPKPPPSNILFKISSNPPACPLPPWLNPLNWLKMSSGLNPPCSELYSAAFPSPVFPVWSYICLFEESDNISYALNDIILTY